MIINGDSYTVIQTLGSESVQCCVTSPPYWGLRDYGHEGQLGLEATPDLYVASLVKVFSEVKRVLKSDGTLWLNLGDSYAGSNGNGWKQTLANDNGAYSSEGNFSLKKKAGMVETLPQKNLCMIPARVAIALQADGWYLRSDIIWHKPNPMPESVTDRPTRSHEYIFLLTKSAKYFYDYEAIREKSIWFEKNKRAANGSTPHKSGETLLDNSQYAINGVAFSEDGNRNKRSVWTVTTKPYSGAHFAVFPEELITPCILAGSKTGDIVLDPFCGSGTTGAVAMKNGREFIGIELNPAYIKLAEKRIAKESEYMFV